MFERIDKEEDGEVYIREVVDFLRVLFFVSKIMFKMPIVSFAPPNEKL